MKKREASIEDVGNWKVMGVWGWGKSTRKGEMESRLYFSWDWDWSG